MFDQEGYIVVAVTAERGEPIGDALGRFAEKVNARREEGFTCVGGVESDGRQFYQAMVRRYGFDFDMGIVDAVSEVRV